MDEKAEKCYCALLQAHKNIPVTAWDDFEASNVGRQSQKEAAGGKGKKQWTTKSRYGYETLDDKYRFVHHEDISQYMEDYTEMFSIANRAHKKWRPNPYKMFKIAQQPSSSTKFVRDIGKQPYKLDIQEIPGTTRGVESPALSFASRHDEDESRDDTDVTTQPGSAKSVRTLKPSDDHEANVDNDTLMMRTAPGLGKEYGVVDSEKDAVQDEHEDSEDLSEANTPKIPLLKQLNTFFLSRNGLKRTNYAPLAAQSKSNANRFPHINSRSAASEHSNSSLSDMTAASIINYRVAQDTYRPPTHHNKITVQNHVDAKHPMVKTILERQKTQLLPLKMRALANSSAKKTSTYHDPHHSVKQTLNQKRFSALNLKPSASTTPAAASSIDSKGLPRNHILKAKNIAKSSSGGSKDVSAENGKQTNGAKNSSDESKSETEAKCGSANSQNGRSELQRKEVSDFILAYGHKSLHPYLATAMESSTFSTVGKSYSKAELVDYSSILDSRYQN